MTRSRISYLDETLRRWPIITLGLGCFVWLMTFLYDLKSDLVQYKLVDQKDKDAVNVRFVQVESWQNKHETIDEEIKNKVFSVMDLYKKQIKKEE